MAGDRPRPIFSAFCDDPQQQDGIDAFVVGLAEHVDDLQDCELRGEFSRLAELAEKLRATSLQSGFDGLARSAASVRTSALEGQEQEVRKALIELTEMAHRVRLGHRGSV